MKKLICIPFAYDQKMNSGVNISKGIERVRVYLENAVVALASAKHFNIECEVALVTNLLPGQIPNEISDNFSRNAIKIMYVPFDRYRFDDSYKWSLAFYKLCVLSYLVESEWDYICYMDTDVYVQDSFDAIWCECDKNILLYDINHGLNTKEYVAINNEFTKFLGANQMVTHYGGEFFAGNRENAQIFERETLKTYEKMKNNSFVTTKGDEFIISIAANQLRSIIKNASPYVHRFWTGVNFRLISTCYKYNPVLVLHLPAEKEKGMIKLYQKYFNKGMIPSNKTVWRICRLSRQPMFEKMWMKINDIRSICKKVK